MKKIIETFTDEEFRILKEKKLEYGKTWHDFILILKDLSFPDKEE